MSDCKSCLVSLVVTQVLHLLLRGGYVMFFTFLCFVHCHCSDIGDSEVESAISTDEDSGPPPGITLKKKEFAGKFAVSADEFTPDLVWLRIKVGCFHDCVRYSNPSCLLLLRPLDVMVCGGTSSPMEHGL